MKETFNQKIRRLEKTYGKFLKYQPNTKWLLFENGIVDPDEKITLSNTDAIRKIIIHKVAGLRVLILSFDQVDRILKEESDKLEGLSADVIALPKEYEEDIEKEKLKDLQMILARSEVNKIIYY